LKIKRTGNHLILLEILVAGARNHLNLLFDSQRIQTRNYLQQRYIPELGVL